MIEIRVIENVLTDDSRTHDVEISNGSHRVIIPCYSELAAYQLARDMKDMVNKSGTMTARLVY